MFSGRIREITRSTPSFVKRVLHACMSSFCGVAIAPKITPHMIADLNVVPSIYVTQETAAVANNLFRVAQQHRPQAISLAPVALDISLDPLLNLFSVERRRIILHCYRIAQHRRQSVCILRKKFSKEKTLGLQNHTLLHNSARGSSL